jgi:hypothetical protein
LPPEKVVRTLRLIARLEELKIIAWSTSRFQRAEKLLAQEIWSQSR